MIIHSVFTMLQQFATVQFQVKIVYAQLTQFCMFSPLQIQTRGLFWWTTSWSFNGQLIYSYAITSYWNPTKQHHWHRNTQRFITLIDYSFELEESCLSLCWRSMVKCNQSYECERNDESNWTWMMIKYICVYMCRFIIKVMFDPSFFSRS